MGCPSDSSLVKLEGREISGNWNRIWRPRELSGGWMERDNVEVNVDGGPPFGWLVGPLNEGLRPQLRMKRLG